jgi:hypothetical protein
LCEIVQQNGRPDSFLVLPFPATPGMGFQETAKTARIIKQSILGPSSAIPTY